MIPKIVKVGRKRWLRGKGSNASGLRRKTPESIKMCCLGFVAKAVGYTNKETEKCKAPNQLDDSGKRMPELVQPYGGDTEICQRMMQANDNELMSDAAREKRLNELAKEAGFQFEFVD